MTPAQVNAFLASLPSALVDRHRAKVLPDFPEFARTRYANLPLDRCPVLAAQVAQSILDERRSLEVRPDMHAGRTVR